MYMNIRMYIYRYRNANGYASDNSRNGNKNPNYNSMAGVSVGGIAGLRALRGQHR
jgi:hypothetical protein